MRKKLAVFGSIVAVLGLALYLIPSAGATAGKISDHALFDGTGGDATVWCRTTNGGAFDVHMAFRAIDGDATLRVTFQDADWVDYPITQDTSFALTQAAGGTAGVDRKLVASQAGGTGKLVGWMSAGRMAGNEARVACGTTAVA